MNLFVVILYAIIVIAGGVIGHIKAGSKPSLIMGLIFGGLLFVSAWGIWRKSVPFYYLALALSLVLSCFFAYRFILTSALMPAGMMAILSILVAVVLLANRKKDH